MEVEDFVAWKPQPFPYGPSLVPGKDAEYLFNNFADLVREYEDKVSFVAERLAGKQVRELERLATAFYVTYPGVEVAKRADFITELKPHISHDEAASALRELDELVCADAAVGARALSA